VEKYSTIPDILKAEIGPLVAESVLSIESCASPPYDEWSFLKTFDDLRDVLFRATKNRHVVYPLDEELAMLAADASPCVTPKNKKQGDYDTAQNLYSHHAHAALTASIRHRAPALTDSEVIRRLLAAWASSQHGPSDFNSAQYTSALIGQRVLLDYLPGVCDAPMEEILAARVELRDQLESFRMAISKVSGTIEKSPWDSDCDRLVGRTIETKIKPAVHDLTAALKSSKSRTLQRVFANLQNPKSYVPLIGSVVTGISPTVALLASMGLTSFKAILDSWTENNKLKQENGLALLAAPTGPAKRWTTLDINTSHSARAHEPSSGSGWPKYLVRSRGPRHLDRVILHKNQYTEDFSCWLNRKDLL
jgi:hypothetical protein